MPAKVRVYRAHNHGPRLAQAIVLGGLFGYLMCLAEPLVILNLGHVLLGTPWRAFTVQFVLPLLLLALFQRRCRHKWWVFCIGAAMVSSFMLGMHAFPLRPLASLDISLRDHILNLLGSLVVGGPVAGSLNVVLNFAKDAVRGRPLIQDGMTCPTCGYCVRDLPHATCPECGTAFTSHDLDPSAVDVRGEWKRFVFRVTVLCIALSIVYSSYPSILFRVAVMERERHVLHIPYGDYLSLRPEHARELSLGFLRKGTRTERIIALTTLQYLFNPNYGGLQFDAQALGLVKATALHDDDPDLRDLAVQTCYYADPNSTDVVHEILDDLLLDSAPGVRWSALWAVSRPVAGSNRATPYLIRALTDPDATVRGYVYQRLTANTGQSFPYDPAASEEERARAQAVWQAWWDEQHP